MKRLIIITLCAGVAVLGPQLRALGQAPRTDPAVVDDRQAEDIINTILDKSTDEKTPDANRQPVPDGAIKAKPDSGAGADAAANRQKAPYGATGGTKKSADVKEEAAPKVTTEEDVLLRTGIDFYKNGLYESSLRKFQELGEKFPKGALKESAGFWTGRVLAKLYRYDEAIKEYSAVTPESGDYQAALFSIGECYQMKGDRIASIEYYQKVYALFPSRDLADKALLNIGKLYLDQQHGSQALDSAVRLVKEYKDRDTVDDAYYLMGKIYEKDPRLKDVETARQIYRLFIKKSETDPRFGNSPLKKRVVEDLARIEKMYFKMEK